MQLHKPTPIQITQAKTTKVEIYQTKTNEPNETDNPNTTHNILQINKNK